MFHHIPEFKLTKNGYFDMIKNTPFQRIAFDDTFAKVKELIGDKKRKEYLLFHLYTGKEFLETLKEKENIENICKNMNFSDNIIDVSDGNKKSLIIIKEKKQTKGYISNISTITLEKRTNKIGGKR